MNETVVREIWVWEESRTICLTFKIKEMPPHAYFCNLKIEVFNFLAAVVQYHKCGNFGHISTFYTKEEQRFSCGKSKHEESCTKNA
jgi:hypothetical protein